MAYLLPTIPGFKAQFVRDFPYATPLSPNGVAGAEATANLSGDEIASITVEDGGSGYDQALPISVVIYGGGGVGAQATATQVGGVIIAIAVTNPGFGYKTPPQVYVAAGGDNTDVDKVTDFDLARAFTTAMAFNMTSGLFSSQAAFTYAYNLLAAHYLCENLIASGTGLGGKSDWLVNAKASGNVSASFAIPDRILKSPILAKLSKTTYGAQFLELISPQLIGNIQSFYAPTNP